MILALNTAQPEHELALIDDGKILASDTWPDNRDNIEKLIPRLQKLLESLDLKKEDVTDIAICKGPGPFTAVRTGIAFANALAEGLGAKLHEIDTFTLLKLKTGLTDTVLAVLHAGGMDVGVLHDHEVKVGPISKLLGEYPHDNSIHVVSVCTEAQETQLHGIVKEKGWKQVQGHELQSMAEVILTFGLDQFGQSHTVEPYYLKEPIITKSTNKWKQP